MSKPNAQAFFQNLSIDAMDLVDDFYDEDVHFQDPVVDIKGRAKLKAYYAKLYQDVESISFDCIDEIINEDVHALVWKMNLKAKLGGGKLIVVDGISYIRFGGREGKAIYHRDYFDLGEFVYENVPVLAGIVKFVKKKLSSHTD